MKIATSEIMRKIDRYCIETLKIPGIVLMENAALKVIKNIPLDKYSSFVIICGRGNNGGDGLAIARHLSVLKKKIELFMLGPEESTSEDCRANLNIIKNMGIKVNPVNNVEDIYELRDAISRSEVTIDAIFGTGLNKNVDGIFDQVISIINENSSYIIAVDVPSGFESDSGKVLGNCVNANKTVTFQLYKKGFLNYQTDKYTGQIVVEGIGIPDFVVDKFHNNELIMDRDMIKSRLLVRDKYSNKGDYGRVLVIAGSRGFTGAAYLSAEGAVRSGAGLVTLCCSRDIQDILSAKLREAMTISTDDIERLKAVASKCDAVAIGPGMGNNAATLEMVKHVLSHAETPVIIDADGINVLKDNLELLKTAKGKVIITPHIGEMARITGLSIEEVTLSRMEVSGEFAKKYGVIVLLKGYNTVITDGTTSIINPTGNSSMASGGMGDTLTGMIASFVAQGYKPMEAAAIATYVHGYCGEKLSKDMFCVNASHVLEIIPYVIKELQE